jgi:uncharacterized protein (DUF305 family)
MSYLRLAIMTALSFAAMYVLMYAMVDTFADVYPNLNQFYMAGLMAASMVIIELAVMWRMYEGKAVKIVVMVLAVIALGGFWTLIRQQAAVADVQFVKSMIPHHSGAILMCRETSLADAELRELCRSIGAGQRAEIEQMRRILARLEPDA